MSELEDEHAIRKLLSAYCFCVDRTDADAFVELFTEDGVWDRGRWGRVEGRQALHDYMSAAAAKAPGGAKTRHLSANEIVSITQDAAAARSYVLVMDAAPMPPAALVVGYYEDQLARVGGRWRFKTRCLRDA